MYNVKNEKIILPLILYVSLFLTYIVLRHFIDNTYILTIVKVLPSVVLLVLAIFYLNESDRLKWACAIFLCAAGDAFLELSFNLFIFGFAAFLTAHFCYFTAFLPYFRKPKKIDWIIYVTLFIVGVVFSVLTFFLAISHLYVVCIYLWIVLGVAALAYSAKGFRFAFWGILIFLLSDGILAYQHFVHPFFYSGLISRTLYFVGLGMLNFGFFKDFGSHK